VSAGFATKGATLAAPFGTTALAAPPADAAAFQALLPNLAQTTSGSYPTGNAFGPSLWADITSPTTALHGQLDVRSSIPIVQ